MLNGKISSYKLVVLAEKNKYHCRIAVVFVLFGKKAARR
jgi:hypothetical protein